MKDGMNKAMTKPAKRRGHAEGFSLLEVLVGLGILTAGLLAVMAVFPAVFKSQKEAEILTIAASLAQMKGEEIRRDDSANGTLIGAIEDLTEPSAPIVFPNEPRLEYSFSGRSIMFANSPVPNDPRGLPDVARVIIRYAPSYRPGQDVIYELRFK
jgi:type II secretory pathway pseudopilin PulG